jgi:hypothetical protein
MGGNGGGGSDDTSNAESGEKEASTKATEARAKVKKLPTKIPVMKRASNRSVPHRAGSAVSQLSVAPPFPAKASVKLAPPTKSAGPPPKLKPAPKARASSPSANSDESKELAWKCHGCKRHNILYLLRCPECNAYKGRSAKSTRTSTEGCEIVRGAEKNEDECAICNDAGGEYSFTQSTFPNIYL